MSQWMQAQVVENKQWTATLYSLYVDAQVPFTAGQFTQLSLEAETPQKFFRPYSFANAPSESPLEFYYNVVDKGAFTSQLSALQAGESIWINHKASGFFVLSGVPSSDTLWLVATGTGLGVFLSLLKTDEAWQRFKQIVLVHSVHYQQGLTHQDLIQSLQQRYHQQFFYLPIVTREKIGHILSQRVTTLLLNGELERVTQLSIQASNSQFMLCGNPAMVKEMSAVLTAQGLQMNRSRQPGQITVESYWKL